MTIPKPQYLVLLVVAIGVAVFMYTRNSSVESVKGPATTANAPAAKGSGTQAGGTSSQAQADKGTASRGTASKAKTPSNGITPKEGGAGATAGTGPAGDSTSPLTVTPEVARAMLQKKVVVLFFGVPSAAEDRKVEQSIDRLKGAFPSSTVTVIKDSPKNIARYSLVAGNIGQTPAVVVVDRSYNSRAVQGFTDYASIQQMVIDATGKIR